MDDIGFYNSLCLWVCFLQNKVTISKKFTCFFFLNKSISLMRKLYVKLYFWIFIIALFSSSAFSQNPIEKKILINFDGICVQNINKLIAIENFAVASNWIRVPPGQDALIAPQKKGPSYKAFALKDEKDVFMLGINDADNTSSCTIASKYQNISNFKKILNQFYKLELLDNFAQGIQSTEIYKADLIQSPKTIIILTYGTQPGINFVSIGLIKM